MRLPDNPQHIFAIVVGVEKYGPGVKELVAPAADALSFCLWLLNRGVPAHQIRCFVNLAAARPDKDPARADPTKLDRLVAQARAKKLEIGDNPTRSVLEHALSSVQLESFGAPAGSMLCVYWSGHGLRNHVSKKQYVLTSDAFQSEYYGINIDDQADYLRLVPSLQSFSKQLLIVDACSKWTRPGLHVTTLDRKLDQFAERGRDQELIFASTFGDVAEIETGSTLSLFTEKLLEALPAAPTNVDFDQIWIALKQSMLLLGKNFLVRRLLPNGELSEITGGRAATLLQRTDDLASMLEKSAACSIETLQRIFRRVTKCDVDTVVPNNSRALVDRLGSFTPLEKTLSNAERYAVRLQHFAQDRLKYGNPTRDEQRELTSLGTELAAWLRSSDQPSLVQEKANVELESAEPMQLFIDLGDEEARVWVRIAGTWDFVERIPKAETLAQIKHALSSAFNQGFATRDCHVELAVSWDEIPHLPIGRDVSRTSSRPLLLGVDLPFTVRVRDRWTDIELLNNWQASSREVRGLLQRLGKIDWLDSRKPKNIDDNAQPNAWVSLHDLDDKAWLQQLYRQICNGAPWAMACRPAVPKDIRKVLGKSVSICAVDEWPRLARDVMRKLKLKAPDQTVILIADSLPLPPGAADHLRKPVDAR